MARFDSAGTAPGGKQRMKLHYGPERSEGESAVALGSFDGVHLGHRKVISLALAEERRGLISTVLTFADSPKNSLGGEFGGSIFTQEQKIRVLEELGVEQLYLLEFSSVKDMTAEAFVRDVLLSVCRAKKACCGFNFTFGRGGAAGSAELARLCARCGVETAVADAVLFEGTPVSSTRIRGLLAAGRAGEAARLLGRPFFYESPVLPGKRLGRKMGTPTLNQAVPPGCVLPRFGVYVSRVRIGGAAYCGVTNVGVNPTVGTESVRAETWMPGYSGPDLYGVTVRTELLEFLRPERRFAGVGQLREAILRDGRNAEEYCRRRRFAPDAGEN